MGYIGIGSKKVPATAPHWRGAGDIVFDVRTSLKLDDGLLEQVMNAVKERRFFKGDREITTQSGVVELALRTLLRQLASERLADGFSAKPPAGNVRRRRVRV